MDQGLHNVQYIFGADDVSQTGKLFQGASPSNPEEELQTRTMPEHGYPMEIAPERREEFSPGLDAELLALIQATAEAELKDADNPPHAPK